MDFDLIIVGGGLAGVGLAAALRASSLRIAIVETHTPVEVQGWDPRIYAITPQNADFLQALGVWQRMDASRINPVHAMLIHGDAGGRLEFSAYESGLAELAWIVESGRIHRELWETVRRQHNVTMLCGQAPVGLAIRGDSAALRLEDGKEARARLVVGADGVDSWVRREAGIEATVVPYGELGVVANFHCERAHHNSAFQWFGRNGTLAYLPLPRAMISMVWSTSEAHGRMLLSLDDEALCRRVAEAGDNVLGRLTLDARPAAFPLRFMRVDSVVTNRVALVGDAAHAIHPLSGHGVNLGFQDVKALADVIVSLPSWRDPGEMTVLRAYARARAEEPFLLQYTTHGLNRLFGSANPLLSALRNAGLNLTQRLPVVRNALVRYAAGWRF